MTTTPGNGKILLTLLIALILGSFSFSWVIYNELQDIRVRQAVAIRVHDEADEMFKKQLDKIQNQHEEFLRRSRE